MTPETIHTFCKLYYVAEFKLLIYTVSFYPYQKDGKNLTLILINACSQENNEITSLNTWQHLHLSILYRMI